MRAWSVLIGGAAMCLGAGCVGSLDEEAQPAIQRYSALVHAGYSDSVAGAEALRAAVVALVASPSPATLAAARTA